MLVWQNKLDIIWYGYAEQTLSPGTSFLGKHIITIAPL